jgi:hypothetical protein
MDLQETLNDKNISVSEKEVLTIADITTTIYKCIKNMSIVCSFVVIFGMIIAVFGHLGIFQSLSSPFDESINSFLGISVPDISILTLLFNGLIELSNGIKLIALEKLPLWLKLSSISLILGWGSLSVHFQVLSIIRKTDIRSRVYLLGKIFHGVIAAIYTMISFLL